MIRLRSKLGAVRHPTVRVGTSVGYLLTLIGAPAGGQLDRGHRAEVQRLIRHDHALHDKQRHDKRRRADRRPPR